MKMSEFVSPSGLPYISCFFAQDFGLLCSFVFLCALCSSSVASLWLKLLGVGVAVGFAFQITQLPSYPICPGVPWITKSLLIFSVSPCLRGGF
jgi:hypothetical protein